MSWLIPKESWKRSIAYGVNHGVVWVNKDGELHRASGPAVIMSHGNKEWRLNGKLHRENGPAMEFFNGTKKWYYRSLLHREDGPAVEYCNGQKLYYLYGDPLSEKAWETAVKNLRK